MFDTSADGSNVSPGESEGKTLDQNPHYLSLGAGLVAAGIILEILRPPSATLTCQRNASATTSCIVTRSILLGMVPIRTERVAGLRGARVVPLWVARSRTYEVTLDTAEGKHRMTTTNDVYAGIDVMQAITAGLRTQAPTFEVSLGFALLDAPTRGAGLLGIVIGIGSVVAGLLRLRRARAGSVQKP